MFPRLFTLGSASLSLLLLGPVLRAQQTVIQHLDGLVNRDEFGNSVAGGRDIDGDGVMDVVVGAPRADIGGADTGTVSVLSGADGSVLYSWNGSAAGARLGVSVTTLPDLNNDGHDEVVAASWFQSVPSKSGIVTVHSGIDGSILHQWSSTPGTFFGATVDNVGDVDGDGFHDLVISAYLDSSGARHAGKVFVYSGKTGNLIRTHIGTISSGFFGQAVGGGHDLTGDGVPDYAVGTPLGTNGMVEVFSGADGSLALTIAPGDGSSLFGRFVELSADVTGDGLAEVFVSSPNGGPATRVFSGADGSLVYTFGGAGIGGLFGWSIAAPGDTSGDGIPDFVVGAFGHSGATGLYEIYSGADGTPIHRLHGWQGGAYFAFSVEGVGDVDGDGNADLVVGCTPPFHVSSGAGDVRVMSGACVASAAEYGSALAGTGGFVPTLEAIGCPALNADFGIRIDRALGGAGSQLLLGFAATSLPAFGGEILVAPPWIRIPITLAGTGPGNGSRDLVSRIQDDPNLVGFSIYLQCLIFDPGAIAGVSMTNALEVTLR